MKLGRRQFLSASAALAAASATPSLLAHNVPFTSAPQRYPSDVWHIVDDRFREYFVFNTPLQRQWTGGLWLEGPAWNAVGRYAVFSDIPRALQMRWDEVSGEVSVLRHQVGHSNGNTFDNHGRLVACEHSPARVLRYEWDGTKTVLASHYQGKRLNAPNDLVALPSGGIIFTDPGYGAHLDYEGAKRELELEPAIYYIDDTLDEPILLTDEIYKPNGIALTPDGKAFYASDTAPSHFPGQPAAIIKWTLADDGKSVSNRQEIVTSNSETYDGLTCDVHGNIWSSASGGVEVDGVAVFSPEGTLLGRILLPEICSNVCF
ncbi:MAG: SMP-30/gluconolactonase/LRE family protein, partial [Halomonas sp.]|nr:SMP-30/gluconolactonase/LRE family protein [Halomonas sp.]